MAAELDRESVLRVAADVGARGEPWIERVTPRQRR
jgi:hypothetical protein